MISYMPLYMTMKKRGISFNDLTTVHNISRHTIYRIKHGKPMTTTTLDNLCFILDCEIQDILYHDKTVDHFIED